MPEEVKCPRCLKPATAVCECPLKHGTCAAGHHWHIDRRTGYVMVDKAGPGECEKPREARTSKLVAVVVRAAAVRVVDEVLADLDGRAGIGEAMRAVDEETMLRMRGELAAIVAGVIYGGNRPPGKTRDSLTSS